MTAQIIPFPARSVKRLPIAANDNSNGQPPSPALALTARQIIEDEIERLISLLDLADGDPDFEDGHDRECATFCALLPRYGVDQTHMANEVEIYRHHKDTMNAEYTAQRRRKAA